MRDLKYANIDNPQLQRHILKRFIGCLIHRGGRHFGERVFREITTALLELGENPVVLLFRAFASIKPSVRLFSKRLGGTSYKLPILLTEEQSYTVAFIG